MPHPQGSVDAARDIAAMELELAFADAAFIEKRIERIEASDAVDEGRRARRGRARDRRCCSGSRPGSKRRRRCARRRSTTEEQKLLVNYQFLTDKPLLVVLNIDEGDAARTGEIEAEYAAKSRRPADGHRRDQRQDRAGTGADVGRGRGGVPQGPRHHGAGARPDDPHVVRAHRAASRSSPSGRTSAVPGTSHAGATAPTPRGRSTPTSSAASSALRSCAGTTCSMPVRWRRRRSARRCGRRARRTSCRTATA